MVRAPYGRAQSVMIQEADIADVSVAALLTDGHTGARYALTGRESLTKIEQVQILSDVLGRDIRYQESTPPQARELWISQGMAPELADWMLDMPDDYADAAVTPGPTAEQVTGRPARTFAQWVADHSADFSADFSRRLQPTR